MKLKTAAVVAGLGIAALLSACTTATPYQPNIKGQAVTGGYSDQRLEADRYRVTFTGNSLTSRETVEGYLLYRAAELTVAQSYDWFTVVDRQTDHSQRTYVDPDPFYRPWYGPSYGFWRPSWRYAGPGYGWRSWSPYWGDPFWADRVDVHTVDKFEASAEIVMHKGAKPEGDVKAFDARAVMTNLGPRVQRPAA
jgi:hypothetical protein